MSMRMYRLHALKIFCNKHPSGQRRAEPLQDRPNFLCRLLIAFGFGRSHAKAVSLDCPRRIIQCGKRLAKKLPGGGIAGIQGRRNAQVSRGTRGIADFQILAAQRKPQQCRTPAACQQFFEIFDHPHRHHSRSLRSNLYGLARKQFALLSVVKLVPVLTARAATATAFLNYRRFSWFECKKTLPCYLQCWLSPSPDSSAHRSNRLGHVIFPSACRPPLPKWIRIFTMSAPTTAPCATSSSLWSTPTKTRNSRPAWRHRGEQSTIPPGNSSCARMCTGMMARHSLPTMWSSP